MIYSLLDVGDYVGVFFGFPAFGEDTKTELWVCTNIGVSEGVIMGDALVYTLLLVQWSVAVLLSVVYPCDTLAYLLYYNASPYCM